MSSFHYVAEDICLVNIQQASIKVRYQGCIADACWLHPLSVLRVVLMPGLDLMDMASDVLQPVEGDMARVSWNFRKKVALYQETFSVIERVSHCSRCPV